MPTLWKSTKDSSTSGWGNIGVSAGLAVPILEPDLEAGRDFVGLAGILGSVALRGRDSVESGALYFLCVDVSRELVAEGVRAIREDKSFSVVFVVVERVVRGVNGVERLTAGVEAIVVLSEQWT
jgi:hypothetical protein